MEVEGARCDIRRVDPGYKPPDKAGMQGLLCAIRHLALVALLVRAMLPAGWMPDAHAGFKICSIETSANPHLGTIHHDGGPGQHDQKGDPKDHHQDCAFAHAAQLTTPPQTAALALPEVHTFFAAVDTPRVSAMAARFSPSSPRAPPLKA